MYTITELIDNYNHGNISGWREEIAKAEFNLIRDNFIPFTVRNQTKNAEDIDRVALYEVVRGVLNKDTINYPQSIGDCVSFGMKNAIEYLQCTEILMKGEHQQFKLIFPPYLYGTGRVFIGRGQLDGDDGSLGSWMAEAVIKYGTITSESPEVPEYSGNIARKWGNRPGPPENFVNLGKMHPVKSAAKIETWEQVVLAIGNGYPLTVASNVGYSMEVDSNGFHRRGPNWSHQMSANYVYNGLKFPKHVGILNSWGDVHGKLQDFITGENWPVGMLRVHKDDFMFMVTSGDETYAISDLIGFEERDIDKALFKLIGK